MDSVLVEAPKTANSSSGCSAVENMDPNGYLKLTLKVFMITFIMTGCRKIFLWINISRSNSRRQDS
jgi:hypothetical protein